MIEVIVYLKSFSKEEIENGNIPAINREYVIVPVKGDSITLFDDGTLQQVHDREFNFDGSISLIIKIIPKDYNYYKKEVEEELKWKSSGKK